MYYKVIIVEDEDIIRNGIKYSIDWHEHNCNVVADTDSSINALKLIEEHDPDILISDINMPVMNGLELIKTCKNKKRFSSIIISGYTDFEYAKEAIELNVVRYLTKPISRNELIEALDAAIEKIKRNERAQSIDLLEESFIDKYYNKITHDEVTKEILDYIHSNYKTRLTMDIITDAIGFSESTINNRLKETVGTTFTQYLNNYRIHIAISKIKENPTINLQELCDNVGIPNYKHFSYVFKKITGFSPREYIIKYNL